MIKYSEIKKIMDRSSYEINMPLNQIEKWLEGVKEDYGLELNPDYQRGNVWTEEQQIAFVEYMLRGGNSSMVIYFNCPQFEMGSCDRIKNADKLPMQCLDGLQRLTAIRKFVNNELPVFNGNYLDDFEDKEVILSCLTDLKFNVNNIQTKKEIIQWYLDYNSAGTYHSKEEIERVKKLLEECE